MTLSTEIVPVLIVGHRRRKHFEFGGGEGTVVARRPLRERGAGGGNSESVPHLKRSEWRLEEANKLLPFVAW